MRELDIIWYQSYEQFINAENNITQNNLNPVCANISKTVSATSDSFALIMSHYADHHAMCALFRY